MIQFFRSSPVDATNRRIAGFTLYRHERARELNTTVNSVFQKALILGNRLHSQELLIGRNWGDPNVNSFAIY